MKLFPWDMRDCIIEQCESEPESEDRVHWLVASSIEIEWPKMYQTSHRPKLQRVLPSLCVRNVAQFCSSLWHKFPTALCS